MSEYHGKCFCGAVEFTLSGAPEAMGYWATANLAAIGPPGR